MQWTGWHAGNAGGEVPRNHSTCTEIPGDQREILKPIADGLDEVQFQSLKKK